MKKRMLICLISVLVLWLLSFMYWYNCSGNMLSKGIIGIKNIVITVYPCDESKKEIIKIDDVSEIEKIYNMLKEKTKIRNNRHPSHAVSAQWDPKFEIDVLYKDGKSEHIFSTEAMGFVCKYLNSKGSSGDFGYRIGKNQMIWEYVMQLFYLC